MAEAMSKLLVIDDEPVVAENLHRILRYAVPAQWTVEHETDSETGLSRLVFDRAIQICVVDIVMPNLSGTELIEQALALRPSMKGRIIIASGWPLTEQEHQRLCVELGCLHIDKPYSVEALEELIWKLIAEDPAE